MILCFSRGRANSRPERCPKVQPLPALLLCKPSVPCPPPPLPSLPAAGEFTHAWTALTTILRTEGRRGIFAGYGSFLLRDLPFDAIEFFAYEAAKST